MKHAQAINARHAGAWRLAKNQIWNVPSDTNKILFEIETRGEFVAVKIRGLAATVDGKVFGVRTMGSPKVAGYFMAGQVSINGKKYKCFTGSRLFERPDKTLCDVDVLWVQGYSAP